MTKGGVRESIGAAAQALARALRAAGGETPEHDARLLAAAAAGLSREDLARAPETPLSGDAARTLAGYRARRLACEPVSRILGVRSFYGRTFRVTPDVLDPRPETETIVDAALEVAACEGWRERPLRILDVGTGSGCLLLTLLAELPRAAGSGTDVSQDALRIAAENAVRLGLGDRARFDPGRSLAPRDDGSVAQFDLLVSNPPYIPSGEIATLERPVRDFDPHLALDGGPDGLDVYRELAAGLSAVVPDGWALFEVGAGQADAVAGLLRATLPPARLRTLRTWRDLGGHIRCVAVRTQV